MTVQLAKTTSADSNLDAHVALMARCFPGATHLTHAYLRWLYDGNPAGQVVGFDAWEGPRLVATYVTIPAHLKVEGRSVRGLLSLNTATDPEFQGKGLFTKLATAVFDRAAGEGFSCVYGIANANSTPGFTRKLGFQLVEPLRAAAGYGAGYCSDFVGAQCEARFSREWDQVQLDWRMKNPANPLRAEMVREGLTQFRAATRYKVIGATAHLPGNWAPAGRPHLRPTGYVGAVPTAFRRRGAFVDMPERMRPSPLNLIFRSLQPESGTRLLAGESFISFLDFDAF
ncbi:MAG: GNAT family N-acetyltransferase [Archangium sp.]|nr:GNAT family N-acetyltransferase [Archangium sp.]